MATASIPVTVEFTGGLEILFSNERRHKLAVPATDSQGKPASVDSLIHWLCDTHMKDPRRDMFVLGDSVRPGILVLINNADWELEGEGEYQLQAGDEILFVSTLHGG